MRLFKRLVFAVMTLVLVSSVSSGQVVNEPVTNKGIYDFLDELALAGVIDVNQAVRPYSRKTIAMLLDQAAGLEENLSLRQTRELKLYRAAFNDRRADSGLALLFNPATIQHHDSLFHLTVTPLLGFNAGSVTGLSSKALVWNNGARAYGYYGNWSFSATLQDNHQDPFLSLPEYLTPIRGGHLKGGTDFSEMTGGVSYAFRWAEISFLKDSPVWGSGYEGSNIFSGRAPSFMQLKIYAKPARWLEMTWIHGWLTSMVVDSARSYWVSNAYGTDYREVYHRKYISANIFTFIPLKKLHISAGNSVIYADSRLMPYYLMPLFFYKSVDHGVNSGIDNNNAQMFIDISSFQIKHLHLYGTLFIDELSVKRFFTSDYNFFSWKGGFEAGGFSFIPGLRFMAECSFTYPLTYQHYVPVLTFENQGYNLGHYLRDNSRSFITGIKYKPVRAMNINVWYEFAERGPDYNSIGGVRVGLPYLSEVQWRSRKAGIDIWYTVTGGVSLAASATFSNVEGVQEWYPDHLYGKTSSFNIGVNWGF